MCAAKLTPSWRSCRCSLRSVRRWTRRRAQSGPTNMESRDSTAFAAGVTVGPSRAEHVQKVLGEARAQLARCHADEFEFRERLAEVPGVSGPSRERPLASPDRTPSLRRLATPTWADERAAVLEAIRGLRELGEALDEHLAEMALQMDELRTLLRRSRDDQGNKEEPLHTLRQN